MDQKSIRETFGPLISYLEIRPGDTFADVGASSGGFTIMMATLMNDVNVYVEDIDTVCLNQREFDKVITYYSKQSGQPIRERNHVQYIIGTSDQTLLPDNFFDCIYTNATFHQFSHPDSMARDFHRKLKSTGMLHIRDSFQKGDKVEYCSDTKCAKRLIPADTVVAILVRNGFHLEKKKDFSGYPIYSFGKVASSR
jgi:ubiquinone/menaquinone biosynthesis C-methylase UbiE